MGSRGLACMITCSTVGSGHEEPIKERGCEHSSAAVSNDAASTRGGSRWVRRPDAARSWKMQTLAHPQSAYLQGLKIEVDTVSEGRQSLIVWINVPVAAQ